MLRTKEMLEIAEEAHVIKGVKGSLDVQLDEYDAVIGRQCLLEHRPGNKAGLSNLSPWAGHEFVGHRPIQQDSRRGHPGHKFEERAREDKWPDLLRSDHHGNLGKKTSHANCSNAG